MIITTIDSVDSRWFYISIGTGHYYLYSDGVIRETAAAETDARAFWPTKEAAEKFLDGWNA
jgi:hypothetical protein